MQNRLEDFVSEIMFYFLFFFL